MSDDSKKVENPFLPVLGLVSDHGVYIVNQVKMLAAFDAVGDRAAALSFLCEKCVICKIFDRDGLDILRWMHDDETKGGLGLNLRKMLLETHPDIVAAWACRFSDHSDCDYHPTTDVQEKKKIENMNMKKRTTAVGNVTVRESSYNGIAMLHFLLEVIGYEDLLLSVRTTDGDTVLHGLAAENRANEIQYLLYDPDSGEQFTDLRDCNEEWKRKANPEDLIMEVPPYKKPPSWKAILQKAVAQIGCHGYTVLHFAMRGQEYKDSSCAIQILQMLLKIEGARSLVNSKFSSHKTLNLPPSGGATPLLLYAGAISYFDPRIPKLLIEQYGADVMTTDNDGRGVLAVRCANHLSGDTKHEAEFIDYMISKGAKDDERFYSTESNRSALHYAAMYGKGRAAERLLRLKQKDEAEGAVPKGTVEKYCLLQDEKGLTPLHYASCYSSAAARSDEIVALIAAACPEAIRAVAGKSDKQPSAGLTPWALCVQTPIDARSEKFYVDWTKNRDGCKTERQHIEGGKPALYLALSLAGAETASSEDVKQIEEDVATTTAIESQCKVKRPWPQRFARLIEIVQEPSVERRREIFKEVEVEYEAFKHARAEERRAKLEAEKKARERQKKKEDWLFGTAIIVVLCYLFRGYIGGFVFGK